MRKYLFLFLLLASTVAMADVYSFRHLDKASNSLYGNCVNVLFEDHDGYLWMGTGKGLFRYDGYNLTNHGSHSSLGVSETQSVNNLQEDASGHLWISTASVNEYLVLDRNRRLVNTISYLRTLGMGTDKQFLMHIDQRGDLWRLTEDSVLHYDFGKAELHSYKTQQKQNANNQRIAAKAYEGVLYILEANRLTTFNSKEETWTTEDLSIKLPTVGNESTCLANNYIDLHGGLWIFSQFSEELLYRPLGREEWTHFALPQGGQAVQNSIHSIVEDLENGVWISTDHRGLFLCNPVMGVMKQMTHDSSNPNSILSDNINALLLDSHHTLWLGYFKNGVSYCHPQLDFVRKHVLDCGDVIAMLADQEGTRWLGTEGKGLWRETPDGRLTQFAQIPSVTITDLKMDHDHRIWVGTYDHGLYCVSAGGQVQHFDSNTGTLPHDAAHHLAIDGYNRVWVASDFSPFFCFNPKQKAYTIYKGDTGAELMGHAICFDSQYNRIILATYYGLWVHSLLSDRGTYMLGARDGRQPLHEYQEQNLLADSYSSLIWMSHNRGITVWDTQADTLYLITPDQGLSLPVQTLLQDAQHVVWSSQISSVSMIQTMKQVDGTWDFKVRNLLTSDNAEGTYFNSQAAAQTYDGRMLFGGPEGYSEFDSRSILSVAAERVIPQIASVMIRDSLCFFDDKLVLHHDDIPLTISFYTGNPLNATEAKYAYRLKGLQDDWTETRQNSLSLLSLPAGNYELQVRAIGMGGEWSPETTLAIQVLPPWWNTKWMRMLYAVLLLVIGCLLVLSTRGYQRRKALAERRQLIHHQQMELSEMKMKFFTDISHDLRTPLTLIISPLEQLLKEEELPEKVTHRLRNMHKNAQLLMSEISTILDFRKIDVGAEKLHVGQPVDFLSFVREQCDLLYDLAHDSEVAFSLQLPAEPVVAPFDQDKMRKVLYNLLSNAVKYSPKNTTIEIRCQSSAEVKIPEAYRADFKGEPGLVVEITDQGKGVSDKDKSRIFDLFYQSSDKTTKSGSGIGLHIARQFVELHGGHIWVEDNKPRGANFRFTLPLAADVSLAEETAAEPSAEGASDSAAGQDSTYTVLVVDDNQDLCEFLQESLMGEYAVLCANSGEEALHILEQETVNLVVSDVMMPGMSGLDLCARIKNDVNYSHIPVILLTARTADQSVVEGLQQGADDYLTKPFQMDRLKLRISKFLEWSERCHDTFAKKETVEPREIAITPLDEQFMRRVFDMIDDNMQDADFGVEALAGGVGMSRSQLYKKLMSVTGKSPLDFIRTMRMKRARMLLERSQMQVSEVAYQVGYNTLKTFTENFKQEFGMTPTEFLRQR